MSEYIILSENDLFDIAIKQLEENIESYKDDHTFYYIDNNQVGQLNEANQEYKASIIEFVIKMNYCEIFNFLIDFFNNLDVSKTETKNKFFEKAFFSVVNQSNVNFTKKLLDLGIKYHSYGAWHPQSSIINLAVDKGNIDIIKLLLDHDIEIFDTKLFDKSTFIFSVIESSLSNEEKINVVNLVSNKFKNKKSLLNYLNIANYYSGTNVLGVACGLSCCDINIIKLLFGKGSKLSIDFEEKTHNKKIIKKHSCCLTRAVTSNKFDIVQFLCENGAKINCEDCLKNNVSLFHLVIEYGSLPMLKYLLKNGLNIIKKKTNTFSNPLTTLFYSDKQNKLKLAKYLMSIGVHHEMNSSESVYCDIIESLKYDEYSVEEDVCNINLLKYFGEKFVSFKDPYKNYKYLLTALDSVNPREKTSKVLDYLIEKIGNNLNKVKKSKNEYYTLHMKACANLSFESIKYIFDTFKINDINEFSNNENSKTDLSCVSCLDFAIYRHNDSNYVGSEEISDEYKKNDIANIMKYLIEKGGNIDNENIMKNQNSLLLSSKISNLIGFELLIEYGANTEKYIEEIKKNINCYNLKNDLSDLALEKIFGEKSFFVLIKEKLYNEAYAKFDIVCTNKEIQYDEENICIICWENCVELQSNCFHCYCHLCYRNMILKKLPCAMCRRPLPKEIYLITNV